VEYVTLPGLARLLELGFPPGNDHEYALIVPSGSLPVPEYTTDCPAVIVTSDVGLVMVPVGGTSFAASETCSIAATEGTPAPFKMKSM